MKILYPSGFTQIPNKILRSKVLKPLQKVVLAVLCSYANDENLAFPSYQTIANDSGISRRIHRNVVFLYNRLFSSKNHFPRFFIALPPDSSNLELANQHSKHQEQSGITQQHAGGLGGKATA